MMIDDELNPQFMKRLKRLRRYWPRIFAGACVCALVVLIVSLVLPKTYRATTYIMVSESKIGAGSRDSAALQLAMLPTFILGGLGFAIHVLWWLALAALVVWLLGFVLRIGETVARPPRRRWYYW